MFATLYACMSTLGISVAFPARPKPRENDGGKNAIERLQLAADGRGCPLGRPADHGRVRKRDQTNHTAVGPVPHLGS
eukprot:scaffold112357_cov54-Phaeocystis_antarctica.AAC.3